MFLFIIIIFQSVRLKTDTLSYCSFSDLSLFKLLVSVVLFRIYMFQMCIVSDLLFHFVPFQKCHVSDVLFSQLLFADAPFPEVSFSRVVLVRVVMVQDASVSYWLSLRFVIFRFDLVQIVPFQMCSFTCFLLRLILCSGCSFSDSFVAHVSF